jgi:phosphatidylserine/phosphatidylglycerophosphate/cardiolipin synthase-like enzyme
MTDSLISPLARARFVVTLPPEPSHVGRQLQRMAATSFTLTDTKDACLHLARRAQERLVIMTPFIDPSGASWAADIFEATNATTKILILRGTEHLMSCGPAADRLKKSISHLFDYSLQVVQDEQPTSIETFHAKIVLADGAAAYVGSANFLYRSREKNLECGFLMEGDAVVPVATLVEALLAIFSNS